MPPPQYQYGYGYEMRPHGSRFGGGRRLGWAETKPFFLTSEFLMTVIGILTLGATRPFLVRPLTGRREDDDVRRGVPGRIASGTATGLWDASPIYGEQRPKAPTGEGTGTRPTARRPRTLASCPERSALELAHELLEHLGVGAAQRHGREQALEEAADAA